MNASQNQKKALSFGLAVIPILAMLLLLIIGYGIMGLRIEPLLLCSAAVAAGMAWWQGYCWEDIINSVVDKLAKAMPVIMIHDIFQYGSLIGKKDLLARQIFLCLLILLDEQEQMIRNR